MKLKYRASDDEVVCMGAMPGLTAGAGELIADVNFSIPAEPLSYFTFNGAELVRKDQSVIDAMLAVQRFDIIMFQVDLATAAVSGQFTMPDPIVEFAPLNTYATNHDFAGMQQYLGWRLALGKVQQADVDVVLALITKQGVVL